MVDARQLREKIFSLIPGLTITERLFDALEDAVFCIKDRTGRYVAVNMALVRRLRLPNKESMLGRRASDFFPPLLAAGYERQDEFVFASNQPMNDVLERCLNRDGSTGWYLAQKFPLHDAQQRVIALAGISMDLKTPAGDDPALATLGTIIMEIQRDYAKPLRMEDLAQKANMPLSRLERMMRTVLGLTPRQLLTRARVNAAAVALRESTSTLGDIAASCGFYDQADFCKQFREATSFTPGQYRVAKKGTDC